MCELWAPTAELGSYWCSNVSAGGWAEVDRLMSSEGLRLLPSALAYDDAHARLGGRVGRWGARAVGAVVHAWHPQSWFVNMFEVTAHDVANATLRFGDDPARPTGGWQGGRVWCACGEWPGGCAYAGKGYCDERDGDARGAGCAGGAPRDAAEDRRLLSGDWYVENVLDELDTEGEFFFDPATRELYVWPNATIGAPPTAPLVAPALATLARVAGGGAAGVAFERLGFRDARKTYLERAWAAPSGGDWSLYRGGAVEVRDGAEDVGFAACAFARLDGNALFVAGRTRGVTVADTEFAYIGDSAVALWGDTDEWDGRGGDQPRWTTLERVVAHDVGLYEKQSSPLFVAKAARTTVRESVFYNVPRAAINFNDGFGGANLVERCVIVNACRESGDHGDVNSWDRMPFLTDLTGNFSALPSSIRGNLMFANYGASQGVDNDDGSSFYAIEDNVFYASDGFKMDYGGHDSRFDRNLVITYQYDDQNCFNVGGFVPGHGDAARNNTCLLIGEDAADEDHVGSSDACEPGGMALGGNAYYTLHGNASVTCGGARYSIAAMQARFGNELGSTASTLPDDATVLRWMREKLGMAKV